MWSRGSPRAEIHDGCDVSNYSGLRSPLRLSLLRRRAIRATASATPPRPDDRWPRPRKMMIHTCALVVSSHLEVHVDVLDVLHRSHVDVLAAACTAAA